MVEQTQYIPDQETFDRLQKELLTLIGEKKSLQGRYEQLMKKVMVLDEVRQPIMEKLSEQVATGVVKLFISEKVMEGKNRKILQKQEEYQENSIRMRNRIAELLQTID